ncbi:hypothetical protein GCM10017774_57040 [Lentzea cavernae]|uniref:Transposase n=1 Tax=Lentzea cavernae TaxID=2020703 RepID=A0ABQ3MLG2_9PSEU|nr:hypothetical protein GCM10017774_57040 [Lentzea cavernae]
MRAWLAKLWANEGMAREARENKRTVGRAATDHEVGEHLTEVGRAPNRPTMPQASCLIGATPQASRLYQEAWAVGSHHESRHSTCCT